MVWRIVLQLLSEYNTDHNQCCVEDLMESEANVSVSIIGIVVYISWALLFIFLIGILFFLGLTPSQSCCCCLKAKKVPHMKLDMAVTKTSCKERHIIHKKG